MKGTGLLFAFLYLFNSVTAGFLWPHFFGNEIHGGLMPRQEQRSSSSQATSTVVQSNSNSASATGSSTVTPSATRSGSGTATGKGTATFSRSFTGNSSMVDPRLPPGGVSMMTPAPLDGMTFVKVGDQVTFKWNYTSLSNTPAYVDVIATNTINSQTYTIAYNQSWQSTQAVTWDTGEFTQTTDLPFVVATYTLMIYDAASDPTAVASAGDLGAFSNLLFGIYTPQPYTPLSDFRCATCSSGAISIHEKQALGVLLGTCTITVLSFTWFASGFFGVL